MHRILVLLMIGTVAGVLLLRDNVAQATVLAPEVQQRMAIAARAGGTVPLIVHFAERIDLRAFAQRRDRAVARSEMLRGLREQARRSQGTLQDFLRQQGAEPRELWLINALAVQVPPALVTSLADWPGVAAVELDGQVPPPAPVTLAVADASTDNIPALGALPLWTAGFTGNGVVVASFDSGVDVTHPELATRWRGGTNSWFDPYNASLIPSDIDGHGTAVTSLMVGGAATPNGKPLGVAPDAQWIAAKIFPDVGDADNSKIHLAFQWAIDPDRNPATDDAPDIVNNSWGFETAPNECLTFDSFRPDIQALQAAGIHVVFSAGNGGPTPATSVSPANYPEGLAVGSIGAVYAVSDFSARGPGACSGSIYNDLAVDVYPELVAPGELLEVAFPLSIFPGGYAAVSGTSFTAPHVSGALALLRSAVPPVAGESAADYRLRLEQALLATSADLGPLGADNSYGRGLVDLAAAYDRLTAQPHLAVYDPAAPENDDHLDFGSVLPGTVKELAFVLKNNGAANLVLNNISSSGTGLTLVANTCPAALLPGTQCTLTLRFAPTGFVSSTGQMTINSNDPRQPLRVLSVSGSGNTLPPPAQLLTPANNTLRVTSPVTFSWLQGSDPNGDELTLTLLLDTDPHFDPAARTILVFAAGTSGVLIASSGLFLWPRAAKRRRQWLLAGVLVLLGLMVACGGGGGGATIAPSDTIVVTNLSPATTYYWKVRTVDSHGGVSESDVWSFSTR